jgi:archaeal type IV pilus assembly protein PilA
VKGPELSTKRKAVAPVIGTLLLIAIAVVGGTIIFIFSQEFMTFAQISGTPTIESIRFLGFDGRDTDSFIAHDGVVTAAGTFGLDDDVKLADERVAVYVENNSIQKVTIAQLRLAGEIYNFTGASSTLDAYTGTAPDQGEYVVLKDGVGGLLETFAAEIEGGQAATLVIDLEDSIKFGRDVQIQIMTTNGAIFVHTIKIGGQVG